MLLCKEKKDIRKSYVLQVLRPGGISRSGTNVHEQKVATNQTIEWLTKADTDASQRRSLPSSRIEDGPCRPTPLPAVDCMDSQEHG